METVFSLLAYAGFFFVGVCALIGLVWLGLGLRNLVNIYYDVWKARRSYVKEVKSNKTI